MSGPGVTLGELAARFGARLHGDPDVRVARVAALEAAGPDALAYFVDPKLRGALRGTRAAAVVLREADLADCPAAALVAANPAAVFARIAQALHPDPLRAGPPGVHPTAVVEPGARIDPSAWVQAHAVIGAGAVIGPRAYIGPACVIGEGVEIGADSTLAAQVTVYRGCRIGQRVSIHAGSVIGADGFGLARDDDGRWLKIPQLGAVEIGDDVEIGACVTIDRGALRDTVIGEGVKLDNHVHIAHNVVIGAHTVMAGTSAVAGSTVIGERCAIGGAVGILGHLRIAPGTRLNAFATVTHSIDAPGCYASGTPLQPVEQWRRNWARFKSLDAMARQIKALLQRVAALEADRKGEPKGK
ncbi:MAG: UDP-3-O-acylglucosamine N-acyltransferase [Gammaproteobacteria bacterium]|nr:MAG: UDP-3-O-acylglucosamine N-acyltransferase [Gammaproteobacteria bacterium]